MEGVVVNAVGIIVGTLVGLAFKGRISAAIQSKLETALGFCALVIGIRMALKFEDVFCLIGAVVFGGILGTWIQVEKRLESLAVIIQNRLGAKSQGDFVTGFTMASVLFCSGAMAVVGAIQSGLVGDHETLYAKTMLDGLISISFGSVYGIGVAFSAISVFVYQGSIALLASKIQVLSQPSAIADISGVGGLLVMMIGVNLIGLKKIAVGDFLPAMLIVIAVHLVLT